MMYGMTFLSPNKWPSIRPSTTEDLAVIHGWLARQDAAGVPGTFLCNWELTRRQHDDGELLVCVDEASGEAIAYQWGGLVRPGILEVREDWRGQGVGKLMVAYRLAEAFEHNDDLLLIQCKPSSSIPFWQRMGFELMEGAQGKTYGFRTIQRALELPDDGEPVPVTVEWFPEQRMWNPTTPALATFSPCAARTLDGDVYLAERVHWFDSLPGRRSQGNVVLRIVVKGEERYCDKARYEAAADVGLQHCRNGYYLDTIFSDL